MEHLNITYAGQDFSEKALEHGLYEDCIFDKCNFQGLRLSNIQFTSCAFKNCDLSNVTFSNARMREIKFEDSKLLGLQWVQLNDFSNPSFNSCILNYSNFVGLKLKKTLFQNCSLADVDFSLADLSESNFQSSDLSKALFNNSVLLKCDFRKAINYSIDPYFNKIKGAKFSLPEAQSLLTGLGIIISN